MKSLTRIFISLLIAVMYLADGAAPVFAGFNPNPPTFSGSQLINDTTTLTNASPGTEICDAPYESYTVTLPNASTVGSNGFIFKRVTSPTYTVNEFDDSVTVNSITTRGCFTSDSSVYFTIDNTNGKLIAWSTFTHARIGSVTLNAAGLSVGSISISSDNRTIYIPSGNTDGKVYVVDVTTPSSPTLSSTQVDSTNKFQYSAISSDGSFVYLTGPNGFFKMATSGFAFTGLEGTYQYGPIVTDSTTIYVARLATPDVMTYWHYGSPESEFASVALGSSSNITSIAIDSTRSKLWFIDNPNSLIYTTSLTGTSTSTFSFTDAYKVAVASDGTYAYLSEKHNAGGTDVIRLNPATVASISTIASLTYNADSLVGLSPNNVHLMVGSAPASNDFLREFKLGAYSGSTFTITLASSGGQLFDVNGSSTFAMPNTSDSFSVVPAQVRGTWQWNVIAKSLTLDEPLSTSIGGTGATSPSGARTSLGAAASGANSDITSLSGLTTMLPLTQGGTAANSASGARTNLGAAASGANSDITSLSGMTTPLPASEGGTGLTSPGAAGNVATSDGAGHWTSKAPTGGALVPGGVNTFVPTPTVAGNGLVAGTPMASTFTFDGSGLSDITTVSALSNDPSSPFTTAPGTQSGLCVGLDGHDYVFHDNQLVKAPGWTVIDTVASNISDITNGPDQNIWFIDGGNLEKETVYPSLGHTTFSGFGSFNLIAICVGPDFNLYVATSTGKILQISTSGTLLNTYSAVPASTYNSACLATGPDGKVWFYFRNSSTTHALIGSMSTSGTVGVLVDEGLHAPQNVGLVAAPDGNMFYTLGTAIGRMTTSGVDLAPFSLPNEEPGDVSPNYYANALCVGPDAKVYFVYTLTGSTNTQGIMRVTTLGVFDVYLEDTIAQTNQILGLSAAPHGISLGYDGDIHGLADYGAFGYTNPKMKRFGLQQQINAVNTNPISAGGTSGQQQYNNAGSLSGFTQSGDVTVNTGTGVSTIANSAVTNAKMANMANNTVKGNVSGSTAAPSDLTQAQITALINTFTSSLSGAVPSSGGGTTNFLRADGTWAAPATGGGSGGSTYPGTDQTTYGRSHSRIETTSSGITGWGPVSVNSNLTEDGVGNAAISGINGGHMWRQDTVAATVNDYVRLRTTNAWCDNTISPWDGFYAKLTSTSNVRWYCGLQVAGVANTDNPTFGSYAMFRYSTSLTDANFKAEVYNGTTRTTVDTGVAADTNPHWFAVYYVDNTTGVKFYIDGVLVATISTNLPTSGTSMYFCSTLTTLANTAAGFYWGQTDFEAN